MTYTHPLEVIEDYLKSEYDMTDIDANIDAQEMLCNLIDAGFIDGQQYP